ncbi:MAG TPA: hypothetical protein VF534_20025, partial [Paraburkholderia sp.]
GGFQDRQARLSSWRGEISPQRRRIDLCKPTTTSKISIAKTGVTIDFYGLAEYRRHPVCLSVAYMEAAGRTPSRATVNLTP